MNASKAESNRSIKSTRSVRSVKSIKSLRNLSCSELEKQDPVFEKCLPLACEKYRCPFSITVKKDYQTGSYTFCFVINKNILKALIST